MVVHVDESRLALLCRLTDIPFFSVLATYLAMYLTPNHSWGRNQGLGKDLKIDYYVTIFLGILSLVISVECWRLQRFGGMP